MEITDVKVIPVDDEKLKAFVSIVFDQCFVVTDIKIIHGPKGLFVSMPSKKRKDGTFKDIAHPLNNQMRQYLEEKVLTVYKQQIAAQAPGASGTGGTPGASGTGGTSSGGGASTGSPSPGGTTGAAQGGGTVSGGTSGAAASEAAVPGTAVPGAGTSQTG
jgi:stage V sporulation protein G